MVIISGLEIPESILIQSCLIFTMARDETIHKMTNEQLIILNNFLDKTIEKRKSEKIHKDRFREEIIENVCGLS